MSQGLLVVQQKTFEQVPRETVTFVSLNFPILTHGFKLQFRREQMSGTRAGVSSSAWTMGSHQARAVPSGGTWSSSSPAGGAGPLKWKGVDVKRIASVFPQLRFSAIHHDCLTLLFMLMLLQIRGRPQDSPLCSCSNVVPLSTASSANKGLESRISCGSPGDSRPACAKRMSAMT